MISVDGLGWARLEGYRPLFVAGLKRLLDEGYVLREARYQHINTETGPGHAALGTGAPPRVTGIVLNNWYESTAGGLTPVYCTDTPGTGVRAMPCARSLGAPPSAGPAKLRVPTLGDRLVETVKGARVVSVSAKDRGAIFLAGRNPAHAVYWYDGETGRFVTSPAYHPAAAAEDVVRRFNTSRAGGMLPARFGMTWKKLAPSAAAQGPAPAPTPAPLCVPSDNPAVGRTPVSPDILVRAQVPTLGLGFDHDLANYGRMPAGGAKGYFGGIYRSPLVDELTNDLVLALLADPRLALGQGDAPDFLAISYSAHDPVAHDYGDESEESLDALRRLDVQIGKLLDALEAKFPAGSVLVALSADHGFPVLPEVARTFNPQASAGRIDVSCSTPGYFLERLNRLLDERLCLPPETRVVAGLEGWDLFYDRKAFPLKTVAGACGRPGAAVTAADVDRVLPGVVESHWEEEIEEVLPVSDMASWPQSSTATFAKNDFDRERSGDVFLIPRFGVMTTSHPGRGAMHGSPYEYDIHVPFVLWGKGIRHEESCLPVTPYQLAPTVGAWLGVTLPDAVGKPLDLPR